MTWKPSLDIRKTWGSLGDQKAYSEWLRQHKSMPASPLGTIHPIDEPFYQVITTIEGGDDVAVEAWRSGNIEWWGIPYYDPQYNNGASKPSMYDLVKSALEYSGDVTPELIMEWQDRLTSQCVPMA